MSNFFSKFPYLQYNPNGTPAGSNGYVVTDITKSVNIDPAVLSNSAFITQINVLNGERSDQIANSFYDNPYFDWLLWLSNQQINPWNWYLDNYSFYSYLQAKYSDYALAQEKISFYTNNWYNNRQIYTETFFESLDPSLTKFYQPLYDVTGNFIQGYVRTPIDWRINTNHIISFKFANTVTMSDFFSNNEIVNLTWDSLGNTMTGQIQFYSNTGMNIFHVSGNYSLGTGNTSVINVDSFSIYGTESNVTFQISNTAQVLSISQFDNISPLEDVYYDPVTLFDEENNKNESYRTINAIANVYTTSIVNSLSKAFS